MAEQHLFPDDEQIGDVTDDEVTAVDEDDDFDDEDEDLDEDEDEDDDSEEA